MSKLELGASLYLGDYSFGVITSIRHKDGGGVTVIFEPHDGMIIAMDTSRKAREDMLEAAAMDAGRRRWNYPNLDLPG